MNSEDFISELIAQTGLTEEQCTIASEIFEKTILAGNKNKELIITQLTEKLNINKSQAEMTYNTAIGLLANDAVDKIKSLFKK